MQIAGQNKYHQASRGEGGTSVVTYGGCSPQRRWLLLLHDAKLQLLPRPKRNSLGQAEVSLLRDIQT